MQGDRGTPQTVQRRELSTPRGFLASRGRPRCLPESSDCSRKAPGSLASAQPPLMAQRENHTAPEGKRKALSRLGMNLTSSAEIRPQISIDVAPPILGRSK